MSLYLLLAVLFLAATNGANDNFKGVAALYSSRTAGYWTSLLFGSATTLGGALASAYLAKGLLAAFTGKGLVSASIAGQNVFALAVAGGAAATVALAAWRGLPISTTHALVGAMSGAGLVAVGSQVHFATLGTSFLLPLLASPLLALVPAWFLARWLPSTAAPAHADSAACLCAQDVVVSAAGGAAVGGGRTLIVGTGAECQRRGAQSLLKFDSRGLSTVLHFLLAGAVSFARGLNDTPKIAALLLPLAAMDAPTSAAAVAAAMFAGGLLGARRVARTLGERITELQVGPGLSASFVTALLVGTASFNGLPVSTTHVSVGGLVGAGAAGEGVNRTTLTGIASAWFVTLPAAALLGALLYTLVR